MPPCCRAILPAPRAWHPPPPRPSAMALLMSTWFTGNTSALRFGFVLLGSCLVVSCRIASPRLALPCSISHRLASFSPLFVLFLFSISFPGFAPAPALAPAWSFSRRAHIPLSLREVALAITLPSHPLASRTLAVLPSHHGTSKVPASCPCGPNDQLHPRLCSSNAPDSISDFFAHTATLLPSLPLYHHPSSHPCGSFSFPRRRRRRFSPHRLGRSSLFDHPSRHRNSQPASPSFFATTFAPLAQPPISA